MKEYEKMKYYQQQISTSKKRPVAEKRLPSANKLLRDNSSYVLVRPRDPKDQEALKDVIASQKHKIDNFQEREKFYQTELGTRERFISVL